MEVLQKLQDSLIEACSRGREVIDVGGFRAMINQEDALEYFSYAMPVGPVSSEDVRALIAHFESRGRKPRLEFCRELWPSVPPLLADAGFKLEYEGPVMILAASSWEPQSSQGARLAVAEDALPLRRVANAAFGMPGEDGDESESARQIGSGELLASIVEMDGQAVGCGFAQGTPAVREVAGIGTLEAYRRRGVASAVITCLLEKFFGEGGEVAWLTPGDVGAQALYTKLGFRPLATQVNYGLSQ